MEFAGTLILDYNKIRRDKNIFLVVACMPAIARIVRVYYCDENYCRLKKRNEFAWP